VKPKQSLEWIKQFELNCNNLNYKVGGIDCWPIARNTLLSIVLPKSRQGGQPKYSIASKQIIYFVRAVRDLFSFKKADIFVLTDTKFSENISGSIYLKDSHVIREEAKNNSETSTIALQNLFIGDNVVGRECCRSVFAIILISAVLAKLSFIVKFIPLLSGYVERLCGELSDAPMLSDSSISYEKLKSQIYTNILFCIVASRLFSYVLKRVRPKRAYVVCYYSVLGMSLCAACRRMEIPITDIQHGVAGGSMRAYSGWMNVPRDGYTTLPDRFLCWTVYDARAIREWAQHTVRHEAVAVGSLWRNYAIEKFLLREVEDQWADFFLKINDYEKKILITMQSSELAPLFVDVVKRSKPSYCFLIRMHPGFLLKKDQNYTDLTRSYPNVFFEQVSQIPIQVLMRHIDLHMTEWSGAVIDAYFENVRSIVISEVSLDYFEELIAQGKVIYAHTLKSILRNM